MSTPRSRLVDETITPWYHCVSRCVRRARLCGDDCSHRKDWIVARLRELVAIFAIHCGGFAVMDNHLHLLLRLDSARVRAWSDDEVARRWLILFPLRDVAGRPLPAPSRLLECDTAPGSSVSSPQLTAAFPSAPSFAPAPPDEPSHGLLNLSSGPLLHPAPVTASLTDVIRGPRTP